MLRPPADLAALLTAPVAVLGGGVSGHGTLALLAALGAKGVVYDERVPGARPDFRPADASVHRLVVFSPGFAPHHPWLATARAGGGVALAELDFAARCWAGRVLAITGTNGKTTLTEFLTHALSAAGERAYSAGNIGLPLAALAAEREGGEPTDLAVCEVSSFQAEPVQHLAPEAVFWANFAEDHLERHLTMAGYFAAKWHLLTRTPATGWFLGDSVTAWAQQLGHAFPPEAAVRTQGLAPDAQLTGSVFATYPQRENFALAQTWWRATGRSDATLYAAARTFRLGAHRLACVASHGGVRFWNDSKATNFHAVEAALATFDRPVLLILGGKAKGGDVDGFIGRIAPRVQHAALLGETSPALAAACRTHRVAHSACATLPAALDTLTALAGPGDHVVLSPGFASFDMFRGYDDRGRQFESLVQRGPVPPPSHR